MNQIKRPPPRPILSVSPAVESSNEPVLSLPLPRCVCPHCSGKVEYELSRAGEVVDCPHCGDRFEVPRTKRRFSPQMIHWAGCAALGLLSLALLYWAASAPPSAPVLVVAVLLCWLIIAVNQLRRTVESLRRQD